MPDNQHRKILGHRDLSEEEIAYINRFKELEREVDDWFDRSPHTPDPRMTAVAKLHLETGFMFAIKSIAKPE